MILKIKSRKTPSFKQLLDYLLHDESRLKQKGKGFLIKHNVKGRTTKELAKSFNDNEQYRINNRKDSTKLQHSIISFSIADREYITSEKLEDMAKQYIKLRNPNGMYVAVGHFEKEHLHLHVCSSAIEYKTGSSMRLSKANLKTLKLNLQEYQIEKYPELSNSIVQHGKGRGKSISDKEYQLKQKGKITEKDKLAEILEICFKKAESQTHFFELLKSQGLKTYERGGRTSGLWYNDRKFRLKTIGYSPEVISELDHRRKRKQDLGKMRTKELQSIPNPKPIMVEPLMKREEKLREVRNKEGKNKELSVQK